MHNSRINGPFCRGRQRSVVLRKEQRGWELLRGLFAYSAGLDERDLVRRIDWPLHVDLLKSSAFTALLNRFTTSTQTNC